MVGSRVPTPIAKRSRPRRALVSRLGGPILAFRPWEGRRRSMRATGSAKARGSMLRDCRLRAVDDLHSPNNKINTENALAETVRRIPSRLFVVNQHDILTGSDENGRALPPDKDMTCGNWTKSGEGAAMVGHHDRMGLRDDAPSKSWNASHPSRGCSADMLKASGGAGLIYCFAAN